jgi:hypothetical protein
MQPQFSYNYIPRLLEVMQIVICSRQHKHNYYLFFTAENVFFIKKKKIKLLICLLCNR